MGAWVLIAQEEGLEGLPQAAKQWNGTDMRPAGDRSRMSHALFASWASGETAAVVAVLPCFNTSVSSIPKSRRDETITVLDCAWRFNKCRDKFQFLQYVIISPDSRRVRARGELSSQQPTQHDSISKISRKGKGKEKEEGPWSPPPARRSFVLSQIQAVLLRSTPQSSQLSPPHARPIPHSAGASGEPLLLLHPFRDVRECTQPLISFPFSERQDQKKSASIAV